MHEPELTLSRVEETSAALTRALAATRVRPWAWVVEKGGPSLLRSILGVEEERSALGTAVPRRHPALPWPREGIAQGLPGPGITHAAVAAANLCDPATGQRR